MNTAIGRRILTQGMIGLSLAAGLHMLWTGPTEEKAAQVRAAADAREAEIKAADAARDALPALDRELALLRAEAESIRESGRLVRDPSGLFAAVGAIADASGVRIDQMEPLGERRRASVAASADLGLSFRITVRAGYSAIASILRAFADDLGTTRVRSASLSPIDGPVPQVLATIETEHFAFEVPSPGATAAQGGGR